MDIITIEFFIVFTMLVIAVAMVLYHVTIEIVEEIERRRRWRRRQKRNRHRSGFTPGRLTGK